MPTGLSVDVGNEFATLRREAALLAEVLERLKRDDPEGVGAMRWIKIVGVAAAIETLYSGCERILLLLAKQVDHAPIDKTDAWHATLLNRMANPFPEIRAAIISQGCKDRLDRFRSFRHRVRNTYGIDLDDDIVLERAVEMIEMLPLFEGELRVFLDVWTD